ncbi:contact-dependent growth inhibition system immunity protein [Seonamhaeicola sp. ML3]|uniref:contact-dependent growth inhibition system immunity protein n=1 Tax=Seonamhaeicola sp. ML3 TaxID=2937786 RepID=UPI0020108A48|nr:contact-dependent growth inhibition system immunity protein [Seonamhaeicola sp. ML3]
MKNTKFENNWLFKSLDSLEKKSFAEIPEDEGYLVTTCSRLRKVPLNEFNTEDLRIMIGQDIGLTFLIPLAIQILKKDILAEGHLYEGDLLKVVLTSNKDYWKNEVLNWKIVCKLFTENIEILEKEAQAFSTGKKILKAFDDFTKIHPNQHA